MSEKVVLILVDGMRADSLAVSGHPYIEQMKQAGSHTLTAQTVMPSVTLPCHMSLIHAVEPKRHGILTNTYTPQVRPIAGLFEQLRTHGKKSGFFYNWSELRDLARPGSLAHECFISGEDYSFAASNHLLTERAITYINEAMPDFTFLYLGNVDIVGHNHGWMSEPYIDAVTDSWDSVQQVAEAIPADYTLIVMSDHGGHDRSHGTDQPEDMTIPIFMQGESIAAGAQLPAATIIDVTPTIAALLQVEPNRDWEGTCLL